jgi:hypothetical protein
MDMKTIVLTATSTFIATISAVAVVAYFFLNTILGAFGMVATTMAKLQSLQASQQVVEKMKKKNTDRKHTSSKRLATRTAKRITSTVLAAATIGPVAVAVAMISFEVADYCDEKRWLHEDDGILAGKETPFEVNQCLDAGKKEMKEILTSLINSSQKTIADVFKNIKHYNDQKWDAVKKETMEALQSLGAGASRLWESTISMVNK